MNKIYSYDNVEAMIESIQSNTDIINSMIKKTSDNDKQIKIKMQSYVDTKRTFSKAQMNNYKLYVENMEDIENMLCAYQKEIDNIDGIKYISTEICNKNITYPKKMGVCSRFTRISYRHVSGGSYIVLRSKTEDCISKTQSEQSSDNITYEQIHKVFSKINTLQIKLMEMLCGVLGRANMLLATI